ncbi:MAG TPA: hypothetical protein VEG42_05370 [Thermoplasmata archaeon]|nr:hypothetical protein [Thermoplasmata archaeon]
MHAFLTATEASAGTGPVPPPGPTPVGAPALVLGGSEDTRLLLRGLLRLHRHRVLFEGPTREGIDRLPPSPETKILVLDTGPAKNDAWADELTSVLKGRTDLHALVILPSADPALEGRARQAGAKSILVRPFAIRDFIQAVDAVGTSPSPP